jgi:outer membrane biosynthesis protein TonB
VDVNPAVAAAEPPKETKYYSDKNSKAANPDADKDSTVPKSSGEQTHVIRTEDVPRVKAFPLNPTVPAEHAPEAQEEVKPKSAPPPGDFAMAKPQPTPAPTPPQETGEPARARPKTIREALALPENSRLAGQKMKQEGGVRSRSVQTSLDVRSTAFGSYDYAIIIAVQSRWYALLDSQNFMRDGIGKVTIQFHLNSDGTATELKIIESTVDSALALLCVRAISDNSPYAPWPAAMRHQIGANYREVTFTFFYE